MVGTPRMNIATIEDVAGVYEGEVFNGKRHGRGKLWLREGGHYEGDWRDGELNGYGIQFDKDGYKLYEGQFVKGKREGSGIAYNTIISSFLDTKQLGIEVLGKDKGCWSKYEGSFVENKWSGVGKLYFKNQDMYYGEFKNDKVTGKGTLYRHSGEVVHGNWEDNRLVNQVKELVISK